MGKYMSKKAGFFLANILQLVFRFAQMLVVTQNLSSESLGVYYASSAYPQLLARVFDVGLPHAARFFLLKFLNQSYLLSKLLVAFLTSVFPFIAVVFLFLGRLPAESSEINTALSTNWFLLASYCLLLILNSILNAAVVSLEKYNTFLFAFTL